MSATAEVPSYDFNVLEKNVEFRYKDLSDVAEALLVSNAYKATKYISEKKTIKATRKRYGGKILSRHTIDIVFTIGRPNYEEREFIKACKKAGEPFPVKKIQLKFPKEVR